MGKIRESNLMIIIYDSETSIKSYVQCQIYCLSREAKTHNTCQQEPDLKCIEFSMFIGTKHVYT